MTTTGTPAGPTGTPEAATGTGVIEPGTETFKQVMGAFCSGVVIVTGMDGERPLGVTAQSFTSLSLDPPLILFCPARTSTTWPDLERTGRFCINILGAHQEHLGRQFARSGGDKFAGIPWERSPKGCPRLAGSIAFVDCTVADIHEAGDHFIVVGRVEDLGVGQPRDPLLFYQGAFRRIHPLASPVDGRVPGADPAST